MGRGLGGILAGYFNCWRPKFTVSAILMGRIFFIYVGDISTFENVFSLQILKDDI
jgi:hypothetical protein